MKTKLQKSLINIFIVLNLMMMIRAQLDSSAPLTNFIFKPVTFIQNYFSMWRGWNMFAPNPLRTNTYIDSLIIFEDGTNMTWSFPHAGNSKYLARYLYGERYRKYAVDGIRLDRNSHLWPDAAKFVLKKIKEKQFRKIPKTVKLRRNWIEIPHWYDEFISHRALPKKNLKQYTFYTYEVNR